MEISKQVPDWVQDLPTWATILSILLGILVAMTVASTILGLVFAIVAVGVELGSATASVIAGLSMLLLVFMSVVLLTKLLLSNNEQTDIRDNNEENPIQRLREQYIAGDITEETFETRLEQLLDESSEAAGDGNTVTGSTRSIKETETTN